MKAKKVAKRLINACNKRSADELSEVLSEMSAMQLLELMVICAPNTTYMWEILQGKKEKKKK